MSQPTTEPVPSIPGPLSLPPYYPIRLGTNQNTAPLVSTAEVIAHLKLLRAFHALRQRVEAAPGLAETDKDGAWALFVSRAVHRFDKWAWREQANVVFSAAPLDVVMVHHAYSLVCIALIVSKCHSHRLRILEHTTRTPPDLPRTGWQVFRRPATSLVCF